MMDQQQRQPVSLEEVLDNFISQQQAQLNAIRLLIREIKKQSDAIVLLKGDKKSD